MGSGCFRTDHVRTCATLEVLIALVVVSSGGSPDSTSVVQCQSLATEKPSLSKVKNRLVDLRSSALRF